MIAYLKGNILKKSEKGIIIDTGNIGYFVRIPRGNLEQLQEREEVSFFIHSQIREDAFDLYGFSTEREIGFFKQLISVNGVGPATAIEILSQDIDKTMNAIINEDSEYISQTPGIGPKTAKRIILELKSKVELISLDRDYKPIKDNTNDDIIEALIQLGFTKNVITKKLQEIPAEIEKEEEIISYFLKNA